MLFGGTGFLISEAELMRELVTAAGADEMYAMFQNPTIDGEILALLYAKRALLTS